MQRMFAVIFVIAVTVLLYGCIDGGKGGSCSDDSQCYDWQSCDKTKGTCNTKDGYCAADSDCNNALKECQSSTHKCAYKADRCNSTADCGSWQLCDSSNYCQPKPGYCNQDSQCNTSYHECNITFHKCKPKECFCDIEYDCKGYEKCNTSTKLCVPLPGHCNSDADCEAWEKCYVDEFKSSGLEYYCGPKNLGVSCSTDFHCDTTWQKCDDKLKRCVPRQGYCDSNNQCNYWEYCDYNSKVCTAKPDMCGIDSECYSWQYCGTDHKCKAKIGRCTTDKDCPPGEACDEVTNYCQ